MQQGVGLLCRMIHHFIPILHRFFLLPGWILFSPPGGASSYQISLPLAKGKKTGDTEMLEYRGVETPGK
jgi:hypothetical protein